MTYGDLKDLASALQSFAITAGVCIGGLWALFRFRALNEQARAHAELDRLRTTLERRATLGVSLTLAADELNTQRFVTARVMIENSGTTPEVIDWQRAGLRTARVSSFHDGTPVLATPIETRLVSYDPIEGSNVDPGETAAYAFLVPLPDAGVYLVEFYWERASEISERDIALQGKVLQRKVRSNTTFGAMEYIVVE